MLSNTMHTIVQFPRRGYAQTIWFDGSCSLKGMIALSVTPVCTYPNLYVSGTPLLSSSTQPRALRMTGVVSSRAGNSGVSTAHVPPHGGVFVVMVTEADDSRASVAIRSSTRSVKTYVTPAASTPGFKTSNALSLPVVLSSPRSRDASSTLHSSSSDEEIFVALAMTVPLRLSLRLGLNLENESSGAISTIGLVPGPTLTVAVDTSHSRVPALLTFTVNTCTSRASSDRGGHSQTHDVSGGGVGEHKPRGKPLNATKRSHVQL